MYLVLLGQGLYSASTSKDLVSGTLSGFWQRSMVMTPYKTISEQVRALRKLMLTLERCSLDSHKGNLFRRVFELSPNHISRWVEVRKRSA